MNERIDAPWLPTWIPATGHALRHAGVHFDAVRIRGVHGERIASELMVCTDFDAGPIVQEATGVRALTRGDRSLAYVGVPALTGVTWPLGWRSVPSRGVPYVMGELLWEVTGRV